MVPRDTTRPATKSDSKLYFAKSREFLATMEAALADAHWDGAGLAAIHAGISAGDAVLAYHGGILSAGQDYRVAVDLQLRVLGTCVSEPSKHLKRLIENRPLILAERRG